MSSRRIYRGAYTGRRTPTWTNVVLGLLGILLVIGFTLFGASLGAVMYGEKDELEGDPSVMIVLGTEVDATGPSVLLKERLDTALDYLEGRPDLYVIVSGGQGPTEPVSEARAMADYLIEAGIHKDRILLEDQSTNTMENLVFSKRVWENSGLGEGKDGSVLVVSNGFHLTRAKMLAKRAGFEPVYALAAPSGNPLLLLKMYIREPLALIKSFLWDHGSE